MQLFVRNTGLAVGVSVMGLMMNESANIVAGITPYMFMDYKRQCLLSPPPCLCANPYIWGNMGKRWNKMSENMK